MARLRGWLWWQLVDNVVAMAQYGPGFAWNGDPNAPPPTIAGGLNVGLVVDGNAPVALHGGVGGWRWQSPASCNETLLSIMK